MVSLFKIDRSWISVQPVSKRQSPSKVVLQRTIQKGTTRRLESICEPMKQTAFYTRLVANGLLSTGTRRFSFLPFCDIAEVCILIDASVAQTLSAPS